MQEYFTQWKLTRTEHAIITDVLDGHTTLDALAAHRGRSRRTIQTHLVRIYRKMKMQRGDMTMMAIKYIREELQIDLERCSNQAMGERWRCHAI